MVKFKRFRRSFSLALTGLLVVANTAPLLTYAQETPPIEEEQVIEQQQIASYPLALEIRGLDGTRTNAVGVIISDADGNIFEGSYNEYLQWHSNVELPEGNYYISLTTPDGTVAQINSTVPQNAYVTDTENVFGITLNADAVGNNSAIYGAFQLVETAVEEPVINYYNLGVEVRGLDGRRTGEVGITVSDVNGMVYSGSFNDYLQWVTDTELPEGVYTIALDTPTGTVSQVNPNTQQYAVPTDTPDIYTIELSEATAGNTSAIYGAFELVEAPVAVSTYRLGVEVRGLDGTRTGDVGVTILAQDDTVYSGSYNEYLQWLTNEELPEGIYTIVLDTPEGTVSQINDTTRQFAVATDTPDVYTITLNDDNLGSGSAIYGAFNLVEVPSETFRLGVEVRGLDDRRTDEVEVTVTNTEGNTYAGSYNEYLQWLSSEELPEGEYIITLDTPEGTVSEINDTTPQYAIPTDTPNVYTITLNADNLGPSSAIYGAFRLVEDDDVIPTPETYRLGVEVRGLDGRRTDDVSVTVTDAEGNMFEGSFNQYLQWLTTEELPAGEYIITLETPTGTVSEINDTARQFATATDTPNVYTITLNEDNLGSSSAIYGAFNLVALPNGSDDDDESDDSSIPDDSDDSDETSVPGGSDDDDSNDSDDSNDDDSNDNEDETDDDSHSSSGVVVTPGEDESPDDDQDQGQGQEGNNVVVEGKELPRTGESTTVAYVLAAVVLLAGGGLLIYRNRRTR